MTLQTHRAGADLQAAMTLAADALDAPYVALSVPTPGGYELVSNRGRGLRTGVPLRTSGPVPSPSPFPDCPEARTCTVVSLTPHADALLYIVNGKPSPNPAVLRLVMEQATVYLDHSEFPLFTASPHPTWVVDLDTQQYLAVNDAAIRQYGYSREEFLAMRIVDIHPADEADHFANLDLFAVLLQQGHPPVVQCGESKHRTRDGSSISVEISWTPICYKGRPAGLVCPRNLTAQHRVEEALRDSELRFRRLTEATFEGILLHSDGVVLEANPGVARIFGYPMEEMIGLPILDLVAPQSHDFTLDRIRHRDESQSDFVGRRKDGTTFLAEVISRNHVYRDRLYRLVAIRDISAVRAAEQALRASEERFRAVFTRSGIGIALLNLDGQAIDCNPALCRILGTTAENIIGHTARAFTVPEDMPTVIALYLELRDGKREQFRRERPFRRGDGSMGWAHVTVSAVRDSAGALSFAVCMVEDVTRHKADEAERRRLEEQLLQSQKVEAIGRLAGGVAHDFNNLLTTVQGYADLLRTELADRPGLHHFAEEIVKTAEEAAGLTRQLLAFGRKQPMLAVPVDVNGVIRDLEDILHRLLPNNITLRLLLARDAGTIRADPVQIKQVILNLVVNARDAMPEGGELILRSSHRWKDEAELICLQVEDQGTGMSDDVKAHLFEPFFTTKPHGKGTGLGLATTYGIVKQSQGWFSVESAVGHGSVFSVYFPRLGDSERPGEPPAPPPPCQRGHETVLVVEDTRPLRELVAHVLRQLGYQILEAADGEEAVGMLIARPDIHVDLLLTDVLMPEMGGEELARWVKARSPNTRILYMSGHNDVPGLQRGDLAPGVALLSKPFTPAGLAEAIRTILDDAP